MRCTAITARASIPTTHNSAKRRLEKGRSAKVRRQRERSEAERAPFPPLAARRRTKAERDEKEKEKRGEDVGVDRSHSRVSTEML